MNDALIFRLYVRIQQFPHAYTCNVQTRSRVLNSCTVHTQPFLVGMSMDLSLLVTQRSQPEDPFMDSPVDPIDKWVLVGSMPKYLSA